MSEPKPFASLSSGLLARKGAARPAMRPQGFGQSGGGLEDLGWNDMGFESPKAATAPRDDQHDAFGEEIVEHPRSAHPSGLTPVESPVHGQQAEIEDRLSGAGDEEFEADEDAADQPDAAEADGEALPGAPEGLEQAPVIAFKKKQIMFADRPLDDIVEAGVDAPAETVEPVAETAIDAPVERFEKPAVVSPAPAAAKAPRRSTRQRSAPGLKGKAAFTLRLDQARHLKLRLACAVDGRSAQMIVTDALDQFLAAMPELDAMAEKAKSKGS